VVSVLEELDGGAVVAGGGVGTLELVGGGVGTLAVVGVGTPGTFVVVGVGGVGGPVVEPIFVVVGVGVIAAVSVQVNASVVTYVATGNPGANMDCNTIVSVTVIPGVSTIASAAVIKNVSTVHGGMDGAPTKNPSSPLTTDNGAIM
jgi:hypothetical protein